MSPNQALTGTSHPLPSVIIGSPIRQKPDILAHFLESLSELNQSGLQVSYIFYDSNNHEKSRELLRNFTGTYGGNLLQSAVNLTDSDGSEHRDQAHVWNDETVWKVARLKNEIIAHAIAKGCDYLFLVDSDLIFHPETLRQLVSCSRPIVSTIYWTRWQADTIEMPQVWLQDEYLHYRQGSLDIEDEISVRRETEIFWNQLRTPGTYEVGGLGACTLIAREALLAGVSFERLYNLSFWGEDRHFCIRAVSLGFKLYVDTHYPAFHIYHDSDLSRIDAFKQTYRKPIYSRPFAPRDKFDYANELHDNAYYEEAIEQFEIFLRDGSGCVEDQIAACMKLADCYVHLADTAKQLEALFRTFSYDAPRAAVCCAIGAFFTEHGVWQQAVYWYTTATMLEPSGEMKSKSNTRENLALSDDSAWTWLPHLQLCVCYDRLGQVEKAYHHNEIAFSYHAGHPSIAANRAYFDRTYPGAAGQLGQEE